MNVFKLPLLLALGFLLSYPAVSAELRCGRILVRKEWRILRTDFKRAYTAAVRKIQKSGGYSRFTRMHHEMNPRIHGNAVFLPWHRYFVALFEKEILKKDPALHVPYWASSYDSQSLETAPIWGDDDASFGLSGDRDGCVTTGPFADWVPDFPSRHCLQRTFNARTRSLPTLESVNEALNRINTFTDIAEYLENDVHSYVHNGIGGDMSQMHSPNDPVFFLHHANIDRLWLNWQQMDPIRLHKYGGSRSFHYLDLDRDIVTDATGEYDLPGFEDSAKVKHVLDADDLCYTYKELEESSSSESGRGPKRLFIPILKDSSEMAPVDDLTEVNSSKMNITKISPTLNLQNRPLLRLRRLEPLSDEWIRMNFLNASFVRDNEQRINALTDKLNSIRGFVSTTALWNRPDSFDKLVTLFNVTDFQATTATTHLSLTVIDTTNPADTFYSLRRKILSAVGKEIISPDDLIQKRLQKLIGNPLIMG